MLCKIMKSQDFLSIQVQLDSNCIVNTVHIYDIPFSEPISVRQSKVKTLFFLVKRGKIRKKKFRQVSANKYL